MPSSTNSSAHSRPNDTPPSPTARTPGSYGRNSYAGPIPGDILHTRQRRTRLSRSRRTIGARRRQRQRRSRPDPITRASLADAPTAGCGNPANFRIVAGPGVRRPVLPLDSAVREEKCKTGGWAPTRAPGLCGSSTVVADDRNRLWTSPPGTHAWFLIARIGAVEEADSDRWLVLFDRQ